MNKSDMQTMHACETCCQPRTGRRCKCCDAVGDVPALVRWCAENDPSMPLYGVSASRGIYRNASGGWMIARGAFEPQNALPDYLSDRNAAVRVLEAVCQSFESQQRFPVELHIVVETYTGILDQFALFTAPAWAILYAAKRATGWTKLNAELAKRRSLNDRRLP